MHTDRNHITRLTRWTLTASAWLLVVVLFHFLGNNTHVEEYGRSIFRWMTARWGGSTVQVNDYSHGWLVPLCSVAMLWTRRRELLAAHKQPCGLGLVFVAIALAAHWIGLRSHVPRLSLLSLLLLLWAIPLYLWGRAVARILRYPCAYLLFCVPLNFLSLIALPLRLTAATISGVLLNGIAIPATRVGTAIHGADFHLDVADPCSGIRSLLAITALTTAFAFFSQRTALKRAVLIVAAVPIVVVANVVRIVSIACMAHFIGQEFAAGFYHNYSGYIVFVVAVLAMAAIGSVLNRLGDHAVPEATS